MTEASPPIARAIKVACGRSDCRVAFNCTRYDDFCIQRAKEIKHLHAAGLLADGKNELESLPTPPEGT